MGKSSCPNCHLDISSDDKCILHCNKDNFSCDLDDFNSYLYPYIDSINNDATIYIEDIIFPKEFNIYTIASKYKLLHITLKYCQLYDIDFTSDPRNINNITFLNCKFNKLNCKDMIFEKVLLKYTKLNIKLHIKEINLDNCRIKDKLFLNHIDIDSFKCKNTIFYKKVEIKETIFNKISCFNNTKFNGLCDFYKTEFNCNRFDKTSFKDIVVFTESKFNKVVDFKYTTFSKLALFRKTQFKCTVNFIDSIFKEEANFLNIQNKDAKKLKSYNIKNRETARIIKHSFEKQDNIIEANKYYALEMEKREDELKILKNPLDWIVFKIHKISSNHSQDWTLALFWILNITFIYNYFLINISPYSADDYVLLTISSLIPLVTIYCCNKLPNYIYLWCQNIILFIGLYLLYDYSNIPLNVISNSINPFSIMTIQSLSFVEMIYKIIIAYLIYQFITSIRQNTRRK